MNSIEEKVYKTFGIEKRFGCHNDISYEELPCDTECDDCEWYWDEYPKITDRILLELISILSQYHSDSFDKPYEIYAISPDAIRLEVLQDCIGMHDYDKAYSDRVRELFKGGE